MLTNKLNVQVRRNMWVGDINVGDFFKIDLLKIKFSMYLFV